MFFKKLRKCFQWIEEYAESTVTKNTEKTIFEATLKQSDFKLLGEITEIIFIFLHTLAFKVHFQ